MGAVERTALIAAAQRLLDEVEPQVRYAGRVCADEHAEAVAIMAQEGFDALRDGLENAARNVDEEINLYEIAQACRRFRIALPPLPESRPARSSVRERAKAAVIKTAAQAAAAVAESARAKAERLGLQVLGRQWHGSGSSSRTANIRSANVERNQKSNKPPLGDQEKADYIAVIVSYLRRASDEELRAWLQRMGLNPPGPRPPRRRPPARPRPPVLDEEY